jgi:hypothetical protein
MQFVATGHHYFLANVARQSLQQAILDDDNAQAAVTRLGLSSTDCKTR